MNDLSIPVLKFLFRNDFKVLKEALHLSPSYEVEEFPAAADLATYLVSIPAGLVITSLQDKNDLIQLATLVKTLKKGTQSTVFKIVVINFSGDKQMEKAIAKLGIQDLLDPVVNTKALKFKLDFWMKSIMGQVKSNPQTKLMPKTAEQTKAVEQKTVDLSAAQWVPALELEDDIWIIRQESDCKKVLGRWLVRFMGPGPYVGQWIEVKNNLWRFDVKAEEKDLYVPGEGAWFYHGDQKPDFVWKENVWIISGDQFELFHKNGEQIHSRFKAKDKSFTVCKNSLFAKTKEQLIIESFDKELVFKKNGEHLEDLEGKGKTDLIDGDPLSGKNKTSHLDHGPLSGSVETDDFLSTGPLSYKPGQEKPGGPLRGKVSTDKLNEVDPSGPASAGLTEGEELGQDRKNTEHKKHYKGHNLAEQYEAEKKEHAPREKEENRGGPLAGKSETEKLKSHYDNRKSRSEDLPSEKETGLELSGKSTTEKLKTHYGPGPSLKKEHSHSRSERDYPSALGSAMEADSNSDEESRSKDYTGSEGGNKPTAAVDASKGSLFSNVLSLSSARDERGKQSLLEEKELEEACADAKVISYLTQNQQRVDCKFDDFFEDTIIFTTASKAIVPMTKIQLDMVFKYLQKETKLNMEGNVLSIEEDGEGSHYVTIQVNAQNATNFESFMELYRKRQSNVDTFMTRVKGF